MVHRAALFCLLLGFVGITATAIEAQDNPSAAATAKGFAGAFKGEECELRLKIDGLSAKGRLFFRGTDYGITGKVSDGALRGEFTGGGKSWPFLCKTKDGGRLSFETQGVAIAMAKVRIGSLAGHWEGKGVKLKLVKDGPGYLGKLTFQGRSYRIAGTPATPGVLPAEFSAGQKRFPCTLMLGFDGKLRFSSDGFSAALSRAIEKLNLDLGPLRDIEKWNKAGTAAQDEVIQNVAKALANHYAFVHTKSYSGGGVSCRIATFRHKLSGLELNLIPGGTFRMGSGRGDSDEKPVHSVTAEPILIGRTEVMQAAWDKIRGEDNRKWKGANLPIENVSWNDAGAWLNKAGGGLRLPSEAEWEFACRAGTTTKWSFGDEESKLGTYAWFDDNSGKKTHLVGQKSANAFGLHDMHGNVWEWCLDHWHSSYEAAPTDGTAWMTGGDASKRVNRGGSFAVSATLARSAFRYGYSTEFRYDILGFRVARDLD